MLKIRTKGHRAKLTRLGTSKGSFYSPPTAQLFDCEQPKGIPLATGAIVGPSVKRRQITTRRGPITIKMPIPSKREKYKLVPRNEFLPERQVSYSQPLYPHRLSEEDREAARLADIARNGSLVQISNKTMDRIYEKFDLLTISDDILKKVRTGRMSKKEARASALLALSKEIKVAMDKGNKKEIVKAVAGINNAVANLIPAVNQIGATPADVAASPLLPVAVVKNDSMFDVDVLRAVVDLVTEGKLELDPDTNLINDTIDFNDLVDSPIEELEKQWEESAGDARLTEYRKILGEVLERFYGPAGGKPTPTVSAPTPESQSMVDSPVIAPLTPVVEPSIDTSILSLAGDVEPPSGRDRADTFYSELNVIDEQKFERQVEDYTNTLLSEIDTVIKSVDMPRASTSTLNKITENKSRAMDIERQLQSLLQNVREDEATTTDVQLAVKKLTQELEDILNTISDDLGEVGENPVDKVDVQQLLAEKEKGEQGRITETAGTIKRTTPKVQKTRISRPKMPSRKPPKKGHAQAKEEARKRAASLRSMRGPADSDVEEEEKMSEDDEPVVKIISPEEIEANIRKQTLLLFPKSQYDLLSVPAGDALVGIKRQGNRADVWAGKALKTSSGKTRDDLVFDRDDGKVKFKSNIISSRASKSGRRVTLGAIMGRLGKPN